MSKPGFFVQAQHSVTTIRVKAVSLYVAVHDVEGNPVLTSLTVGFGCEHRMNFNIIARDAVV